VQKTHPVFIILAKVISRLGLKTWLEASLSVLAGVFGSE